MRNRSPIIFQAALMLSLVACATDDEPPPDLELQVDPEADVGDDGSEQEGALAALACPVSNTNVNRSLVERDPTVLAKFSFARVMTQIQATARVSPTQTAGSVFQAWMKTFGSSAAPGDCNDANIDPQHFGLQCPRTPEAKLATVNPLLATSTVKFTPVGLFNRFDLAPANGANCGEYRIVYAMSSTNPNISGRAFIIFEATLPNPTPAAGIAACLPVARFWQDLTNDASATSRAAKLEKLYLLGTALPGFKPVVSAGNYGLANGATAAHTTGQIRTNFFVDFQEWHLREFKLRRTCTSTDISTCRLAFKHVTVKTNPANELFAGTHTASASFRTSFVSQIPALIRPNVATLGMATPDTFNELESVSQRADVLYSSLSNATMRSAIQTKLTALGSTLTVNNVLERATTQTCAGCHQVSNGRALGGGLVWPASLGFVQIDEARALSPALITKFLPRRKAVLEAFINQRCATPIAAARSIEGGIEEPAIDGGVDELTVGGSLVGGAN
jgi:hypothetical protein